jgi:hypothetical protein
LGGWNVCGDKASCDSSKYFLHVLGAPTQNLAVGQSLRVSAGEAACPAYCDSEVAKVDWRASAPGIVSFAPRSTFDVDVTGLAPGQVAVTAEITFKSGVKRLAETVVFSDSPLLLTVVPAASR